MSLSSPAGLGPSSLALLSAGESVSLTHLGLVPHSPPCLAPLSQAAPGQEPSSESTRNQEAPRAARPPAPPAPVLQRCQCCLIPASPCPGPCSESARGLEPTSSLSRAARRASFPSVSQRPNSTSSLPPVPELLVNVENPHRP